LCGRGSVFYSHPGNRWFRTLVIGKGSLYQNCPKYTKLLVAKQIVAAVIQQRNPPGRFIIKSITTGDGAVAGWTQITYEQALGKTSQALRDVPKQRKKRNNKQQVIQYLERRRTGYDDDTDRPSHINTILIDSDDDGAEIAASASASASASAGTDIFNTRATETRTLSSQQTKRSTLVLVEEAIDKTLHALHALRDLSQHQELPPTRLATAVVFESPWNNNNNTGNPSFTATATKHRGENQATGNVARWKKAITQSNADMYLR
jgi:hypothetical protein